MGSQKHVKHEHRNHKFYYRVDFGRYQGEKQKKGNFACRSHHDPMETIDQQSSSLAADLHTQNWTGPRKNVLRLQKSNNYHDSKVHLPR